MNVWNFCLNALRKAAREKVPSNIIERVQEENFIKESGLLNDKEHCKHYKTED